MRATGSLEGRGDSLLHGLPPPMLMGVYGTILRVKQRARPPTVDGHELSGLHVRTHARISHQSVHGKAQEEMNGRTILRSLTPPVAPFHSRWRRITVAGDRCKMRMRDALTLVVGMVARRVGTARQVISPYSAARRRDIYLHSRGHSISD